MIFSYSMQPSLIPGKPTKCVLTVHDTLGYMLGFFLADVADVTPSATGMEQALNPPSVAWLAFLISLQGCITTCSVHEQRQSALTSTVIQLVSGKDCSSTSQQLQDLRLLSGSCQLCMSGLNKGGFTTVPKLAVQRNWGRSPASCGPETAVAFLAYIPRNPSKLADRVSALQFASCNQSLIPAAL